MKYWKDIKWEGVVKVHFSFTANKIFIFINLRFHHFITKAFVFFSM